MVFNGMLKYGTYTHALHYIGIGIGTWKNVKNQPSTSSFGAGAHMYLWRRWRWWWRVYGWVRSCVLECLYFEYLILVNEWNGMDEWVSESPLSVCVCAYVYTCIHSNNSSSIYGGTLEPASSYIVSNTNTLLSDKKKQEYTYIESKMSLTLGWSSIVALFSQPTKKKAFHSHRGEETIKSLLLTM